MQRTRSATFLPLHFNFTIFLSLFRLYECNESVLPHFYHFTSTLPFFLSHFRLDECNDRVNSKTKTTETCLEEVMDFYHCVDHCAGPKIFAKLKWTFFLLEKQQIKTSFWLVYIVEEFKTEKNVFKLFSATSLKAENEINLHAESLF